jgi:phage shock protein PspC (stress-responsive transcriptional regulator)
MSDVNGSKTLYRVRQGRIVAGVCSGMGEYFGVDPNLVRVIFAVVAILTGGFGALLYLAAWALIPEEGEKQSLAQNWAKAADGVINKDPKA